MNLIHFHIALTTIFELLWFIYIIYTYTSTIKNFFNFCYWFYDKVRYIYHKSMNYFRQKYKKINQSQYNNYEYLHSIKIDQPIVVKETKIDESINIELPFLTK